MRTMLAIYVTLAALSFQPAAPSGAPGLVAQTPEPSSPGDARRSTAAERESVAITVYNQNFGLVREIRTLDLNRGLVNLEFADVASGIQPETVHIRPLGGPGVTVLEQNYQYDLLNPQKLLEKYVGRTVTVYRRNGSEEEEIEAEVLSVNGGPILRIDGMITFNYPGRFGFPELPDDLIAEPTLLWRLDAAGTSQRVEVTYLTNDLNWRSDYVMVLNEDDTEADLTGWVTLVNQSGATYEGAQLQLVAGDVRRVSGRREDDLMVRTEVFEDAMRAQAAGFSEESFFEYHLYTLGRAADVVHNEQKQVVLLEANAFEVEKTLIFRGRSQYFRARYEQLTRNQKVGVFLEFTNSEDRGLGMPLPKGTIRVYKRDGSGSQQFVGEDLIDHTPRDEEVRIQMGEAFDVVADRRQMDYTVISRCVSESTWQIDVRSHKDEDVTVTLVEPAGGDWEIVRSSHPHTLVDAGTFTFEPEVPARGEVRVEYRVRVRWC